MYMNDFLANNEAAGFVDWLCQKLTNIPINLSIASSRYVPQGLQLESQGIEKLCNNYQWNAQWTDSKGSIMMSSDWRTTKASLSELSNWLKSALAAKNNAELLKASCATLEWGGAGRAVTRSAGYSFCKIY